MFVMFVTKDVHQWYQPRFCQESGNFLVQTDIWIFSGPDQKQTGSGQNSDFVFEIEKIGNSKKLDFYFMILHYDLFLKLEKPSDQFKEKNMKRIMVLFLSA